MLSVFVIACLFCSFMHETEENKDDNTLKPNANLADATIFHLLVLGFVLGWLGLTLGWLALALVPRGYIRKLPWPPLFPPFIELSGWDLSSLFGYQHHLNLLQLEHPMHLQITKVCAHHITCRSCAIKTIHQFITITYIQYHRPRKKIYPLSLNIYS